MTIREAFRHNGWRIPSGFNRIVLCRYRNKPVGDRRPMMYIHATDGWYKVLTCKFKPCRTPNMWLCIGEFLPENDVSLIEFALPFAILPEQQP